MRRGRDRQREARAAWGIGIAGGNGMVRETRHLWVGNLPKDVKGDRITEHFERSV